MNTPLISLQGTAFSGNGAKPQGIHTGRRQLIVIHDTNGIEIKAA